ncbi:WLM domain-containing protein, partial [Ochromonadaceae sp. CCMP2298]
MSQPPSQYVIVKRVAMATMPNPALARELLEKLVHVTAKVVAARRWRVPVLKEFYPKNRGLLGLNVNAGQTIMIRLREAHDEFSFLPWHSVLGTLVHELTHNVVGEHSAEFYELMDKVYDEVDA